MNFKEKYYSRYNLLTDQISLSFLLFEISSNLFFVTVSVIQFVTLKILKFTFGFLLSHFSTRSKKSRQKFKH